jgi:hypothetical protein
VYDFTCNPSNGKTVSKVKVSDHDFDPDSFPDPPDKNSKENKPLRPSKGQNAHISKVHPAPDDHTKIKEPKKVEKKKKQENIFDVDPHFLYVILSGNEDFESFGKRTGYTERELQGYFIVAIRMINILFELRVSEQFLSMEGIMEHRSYWLKYIKEYEMMEKFDKMPVFDRFKEYFRTLNYSVQKDAIEQLKAIHEGRE